MAGRTPDPGDSRSFNLTVPAGLYDFLHRHSLRAIIGKSPGEVAVHLMMQQAVRYDAEGFLAIKLPTADFPNPEARS